MTRLFDRWSGDDLARLFDREGVFARLRGRGFADFAVAVDDAALAHVRLSAAKHGRRHQLLDACLRRLAVPLPGGAPLELLLVHWVREQDPTAAFRPGRPRLPLQDHPGLGVLRSVFRVAVQVAAELAADGVASQPKFFHDALIFYRSRLFLFLDGAEQGRFEALDRDLAGLPLAEASLAVAAWRVRDRAGAVVRWQPGFQVFPLSDRLTAHFNAPAYAAAVAAARDAARFTVDTAQ